MLPTWLTRQIHFKNYNWGQEEKGVADDEMVRKHHWLNGHEFEQTPRDSEWQGSLVCATVHGVAKSQTRLSEWTTKNFNEHKMYKDVIYDNNNIKDEDGNYIEVDFSMLLKLSRHQFKPVL